MTTLRGQLTAWLIGLITIIGITGSIGTAIISSNEENSFLDDQLRQIALTVGDKPSAAGESSHIIAGVDPEDRFIVRILDNDMKTIRNSDPDVDIPVEAATGFYDHVNNGVDWRTFTLIAENRMVQVSQQKELRTAAVFSSVLTLILPIALLVPMSWILVGFVVNRLLKPLKDLAAALLARQTGSDIKLNPKGIPGEVAPVVDAMNDLLVRQHELLEFRQRFISDAAHQLRTPLTALNLQMENLKRASRGKATSALLRPIEQGLGRMSTLLNQLMKLAHADDPLNARQMQTVELGNAVRASLADVHESAMARSIDLGLAADATVTVHGDRLDLVMLIGNLMDNAIRYTPPGGKVDVEILARENEAVVKITDTGPGVPEDELNLVFNRFYRANPSASEGSGLGLSIVAALAARNGAEVRLQNRVPGPGLEASVNFKVAPPSAMPRRTQSFS
jgi:two-component system, OmpR family, sensor kinase